MSGTWEMYNRLKTVKKAKFQKIFTFSLMTKAAMKILIHFFGWIYAIISPRNTAAGLV